MSGLTWHGRAIDQIEAAGLLWVVGNTIPVVGVVGERHDLDRPAGGEDRGEDDRSEEWIDHDVAADRWNNVE